MLKTVQVIGKIYTQGGEPAKNVGVTIALNQFSIEQGHIILSVPIHCKTDANGMLDIQLWPNPPHEAESWYTITCTTSRNAIFQERIRVPDVPGPVRLEEIIL